MLGSEETSSEFFSNFLDITPLDFSHKNLINKIEKKILEKENKEKIIFSYLCAFMTSMIDVEMKIFSLRILAPSFLKPFLSLSQIFII